MTLPELLEPQPMYNQRYLNEAIAAARDEARREFQACYDELREWAWNNIDASGNVDFDRMVERHAAILADKQAYEPKYCLRCGPDGAIRHGDSVKICPDCGGSHILADEPDFSGHLFNQPDQNSGTDCSPILADKQEETKC